MAAARTWDQGTHARRLTAIKEGMTANEVRQIAGLPDGTTSVRLGMGEYQRRITEQLTDGGPPVLNGCWVYHAKANLRSSLLGVTVCFAGDRVLRAYYTVHG